MSIIDRIILTLYTCSLGVAAVLIMIVSLNLVPLASRIPGRWEYTVGGAVLFMMSLRLLVAGWSRGSSSSLTIDTEHEGQIHVSQRAMEDYIASFTNDVYGVHGAKAKVKMNGQQIEVRINASIEPGINIPDTTEEVRRTVKKNILTVIGVEVSDVELYFKHIKAKE